MSTKKKPARRVLNPSPANYAAKLDRLAARMERLGLEMQFYGGFGEMAQHGIEMQGAAKVARTWSRGLRAL
jgi:hypothetical protein